MKELILNDIHIELLKLVLGKTSDYVTCLYKNNERTGEKEILELIKEGMISQDDHYMVTSITNHGIRTLEKYN